MASSKKLKMDICIAWEEIETTNGFQKMWVLRYGKQKLIGCFSKHKFIVQSLRLALRCNDITHLTILRREKFDDKTAIEDISYAESQYHEIIEDLRHIK